MSLAFHQIVAGENFMLQERSQLNCKLSSRVASVSGVPPVANPAQVSKDVDRWVEEQMFEEDVRAVIAMMRPHSRERLLGWNEYRTGGAHFRVTVSWDNQFDPTQSARQWTIPNLGEVLEAIVIGSARHDDDLHAHEEFDRYRAVVRRLYDRLNELENCYT